ncbi:related to Carrier protein YMC1, mitochondrial precursor [Sporisorium scitamineum]|uniref:Related to Carrier protein YMC1, mitochondrial n=1 Tax=Sporisorium scitamineum TaxID=49012 RepID=A0A0F7S766_9BASI|nr:related to Carrier protein YMC1, mitochondrial precursor [Sporisorium scitamineum]CDW97114.1 hypothetical protein [Sporisorium scitamineum]
MVSEEVVAATGAAPLALVDFIAGTAGGIASLLAGHPFDTVKTRLQAQPSSSAPSIDTPSTASSSSKLLSSSARLQYSSTNISRHVPSTSSSGHAATLTLPHSCPTGGGGGIRVSLPIYRSATDAFRIIIKEERIWGLYKGVTSPMLGVAIMNASIFGLYNISLRYQQTHHLFESSPITQVFIAGMLSGLGSSLITSPIDLIKICEQMDASSRSGTWRVLRHVVRTEGVRKGVFRGWCTTAVRDLGYGPYFASYELLNSWIRNYTGGPLSNVDMAVSGAFAGVVAWLSTFWADVIKTKIQATTRFDDGQGKRSLFWSTARETYASGGWRAFFVGVGPTVLRALPVNAVLFVTYEATKDLLVSRGY